MKMPDAIMISLDEETFVVIQDGQYRILTLIARLAGAVILDNSSPGEAITALRQIVTECETWRAELGVEP